MWLISHRLIWLTLLLSAISCGLTSCLPYTETVYPLLTYHTAWTRPKGNLAFRFGAGSSPAQAADGRDAVLNEPINVAELRGGISYSISNRSELDADAMMSIGSHTTSGGFRLGLRTRVTPEQSVYDVAVQPGLVITHSQDRQEETDPSNGHWQKLSSTLVAFEMRLPVSRRLSRRVEVAGAIGAAGIVTYHHYSEGGIPHPDQLSKVAGWPTPLATLGIRLGPVMLETGVCHMYNDWHYAAGIVLGRL